MTQAQSKSYGGVKKKLMGAVCMLLVASIMMVSSTYAWFTLSTAPEITGISTSVGANGNLEMALLNGVENGTDTDADTYAETARIKSGVGNSMANTTAGWTVQKANLTWGNLVDLTTGYGLETIKLMPAAANYAEGAAQSKLDTTSLLATAVYGKDGRVNTTDGSTLSAVYSDGGFTYSASQHYGVRAVGVASNVTAREAAFNSAKNSYRISVANTQSAISANVGAFMPIVTGLLAESGNIDFNMNKAQITGMIAIAEGMLKDFQGMDVAMKNAILATAAASNSVTKDQFETIQTALASVTDASTLKNTLTATEKFVNGTVPEGVSEYLDDATNAETSISSAIASLQSKLKKDGADIGDDEKVDVSAEAEKLLGEDIKGTTKKYTNPIKVYLTGGALGTLAKYHGTFMLKDIESVGTAYAGYGVDTDGTWTNTDAKLAGVTAAVTGLTYSEGSTTEAKTITDTYGYVLDMAFRTNATGSYLKLQTAATQRIYQGDNNNADTQGSGSNMTFTYGDDVTAAQAEKLMKAVRVVFFNPENGNIYATAKLGDVDTDTPQVAKANLVVDPLEGDKADKIVEMQQNQATKVSILVYLDGGSIDNSAVSNGAQTGTAMKLNLQFASSVNLVPMQNSALKNGTGTTSGAGGEDVGG